jgi:two-component system sensor histidine kinase BaeS
VRRSLATQVAVVTTVVALLSVLVAGLVALPLARSAAQDQAQEALSRQADVLARAADRAIDGRTRPKQVLRLQQSLKAQGVELAFVPVGAPLPLGLDDADTRAIAEDGSLNAVRTIDGSSEIVQVRRLDNGTTVVLTQPLDAARNDVGERSVLERLVLALVIGLGIGALAGVLLAARLARPLQRASMAAQRLATGARNVRLEPEGPREAAELAEALNHLAGALEVSESRQRDFLLSVSHELRTPLTAVKGYAEALADGVVEGDDVAATGATVLDEARRLERLVNDLLDLARFGAQDLRLDLTVVDLSALAADAGTVWSDRSGRVGVEYLVEVDDGLPAIRTDATRLRQIIDNLSENALRVTPSGAPIVLAMRREPGTIVIEVRDGGPGLTPDDMVVAFQPAALFTKYKGVRKVGSGVGLALVGTLAQRLGGVAEAGSAPEGGARFAVRLPG